MDDSILDDFLVDSHEGLDRLDRDLLALERDPAASEPVASAFRSLHTIKGTCSFLGLRRLERVAHAGESLLAALRAGRKPWSRDIADALLATADTVRAILAAIESGRSTGDPREPAGDDRELLARLAELSFAGHPAGAPAVPTPAAPSAATAISALQQQQLRVDVRRLDAVMDLVGELVLARNQLLRSLAGPSFAGPGFARYPPGHEADAGSAGSAAGPLAPHGSTIGAAAQRLDQATTRLQDEIMRTRMQPISAAWARLPRLVRDVASACGKRVRLETRGDGTELDRALVEALKDPLTHLVRNAIDHGIEDPAARASAGKPAEGVLRLTAFEAGGSVRLELSDDGAGMPVERIREQAVARGLVDAERARRLSDEECLAFVFLPGFSTAPRVTSISGRGVGLDAARAAIEAVGGSLGVRAAGAPGTAGSGTTFHIRLPLTLAILPALTLEESGEIYAVPQAHVLELVRCGEGSSTARIERAHDRPVFRLRGELLPVVELGRSLAAEHEDVGNVAPRHLLVLAADGQRFGLAVERVRDTEDIVVKPIGHRLREGGVFAGATVLGDGRVALILDVHALAMHSGLGPATDIAAGASGAPSEASAGPAGSVSLLLVRARRGVRAAVRLEEIERVVEFESTAFERLDEHPAVRLDGEVLPVSAFAGDPSLATPGAFGEARTWPVLVHGEPGHRVGLVVDAVVDIVDWDGAEAPKAARGGGPRRIVLDDHITDLVTLAEAAS